MRGHGGDTFGREDCIDFSANINPLGPPEGVKKILCQCADRCSAYPDPFCRDLRKKIGQREGLHQDCVLCGNGAADIIYRLALGLKPRSALLLAPTFSEYESALEQAGCDSNFYALSRNFNLKEDILDDVDGLDLVVICNPNNPTGCVAGKPLMQKLLAKCKKEGALLAVDECFMDFVDSPELFSIGDLVKSNKNLLVMKAFTKLYAMAGLRLGYALCSDRSILCKMAEAGPPWAVSTPAQECGAEALEDREYVEQTKRIIRRGRDYIKRELMALGCRVYGSMANYVFFQSVPGLYEKMLKRRIIIRSCADFRGLDERYYRVAVRRAEDNEALIAAMREALNEG